MKNLDKAARKFLPLSEATYLILASLTEPRHGYGIMQDVEAVSGGRVKVGPGTLYGALTNLLKQKLIRRSGETGAGSDRRKVYALTALGESVLVLEGERLASLSRLALDVKKRLGGLRLRLLLQAGPHGFLHVCHREALPGDRSAEEAQGAQG